MNNKVNNMIKTEKRVHMVRNGRRMKAMKKEKIIMTNLAINMNLIT